MQHYVAGGCTHAFHDGGFEFDTGLHYVGRIEKYKMLLDLVSGRDAKKVEWAKMGRASDGFCYDEIKLGGDKPWGFKAGAHAFVDDLAAEFPGERAAIEQYVRLSAKVNKMADLYYYAKLFHPIVQWVLNKTLNREYFRWASRSTWDVVSELTTNKRLRAILCGQFGDYGLKPQDSSFLIQAGITAHYMDAAYYPIGGSQEISRALIPTITDAGGAVLVKARVQSIEIDASSGRAVGVKVCVVDLSGKAKGEAVSVRATCGVISGAGAYLTNRLVPEAHRARLGYAPMLKEVKQSISHVYAFVGMKGTAKELELRGANLWVLPVDDDYNYCGAALDASDKGKGDHGDPFADVGNRDDHDDMALFMGFPSCKDPSFEERFPGKSTCEIITTAHSEWFERYLVEYGESKRASAGKEGEKKEEEEEEDVAATLGWEEVGTPKQERAGAAGGNPNQSGKRKNPEYTAMKKGLEEKLLRALYRHFPATRGKVEYVNIATPLSNLYYLARPDSYGLEHTTAHYAGGLDKMRPATDIPGLYATGQDIGTVGIVGALNGGILTAHACLGYGFVDLVVQKRNLIEDLMAVDADFDINDYPEATAPRPKDPLHPSMRKDAPGKEKGV